LFSPTATTRDIPESTVAEFVEALTSSGKDGFSQPVEDALSL